MFIEVSYQITINLNFLAVLKNSMFQFCSIFLGVPPSESSYPTSRTVKATRFGKQCKQYHCF